MKYFHHTQKYSPKGEELSNPKEYFDGRFGVIKDKRCKAEDVVVWKQIETKIVGLPLVVLNKVFDKSCLKAAFRFYQIDYLDSEFHCTCIAYGKKDTITWTS